MGDRMINNAERNAKIVALYETGATYDAIARQLGVTRNVVAGHIYRAALVKRPMYPEHIRQIILQSAEERGITKAAREWGVSVPSIYNWRKSAA
jgi:transposase-like protein